MKTSELRANIAERFPGATDSAAVGLDGLLTILEMAGLIEREVAASTRCEPPVEARARRWHWVDVPANDGRRIACWQWAEEHWWPLGRKISPEIAAAAGWRYIGAAEEPSATPAPLVNAGTGAVWEYSEAVPSEAAPSQRHHSTETSRVVPPNLPLPIGMHYLKDRDGKLVKAVWRGDVEEWLVGELRGAMSPAEVAARGFEYLAALPEAPLPPDEPTGSQRFEP